MGTGAALATAVVTVLVVVGFARPGWLPSTPVVRLLSRVWDRLTVPASRAVVRLLVRLGFS